MDHTSGATVTKRGAPPHHKVGIGEGKSVQYTLTELFTWAFPNTPKPDFAANPDYWHAPKNEREAAAFLKKAPRTLRDWRYRENGGVKEPANV